MRFKPIHKTAPTILPKELYLMNPRLIAFYLPQFHNVAENNEWWGYGYTEWVAARRAQCLFEGHDMPRLPTDLGCYDLMEDDGIYTRQATLAKAHGINAFCFYYYWFQGRRILEKPLNKMLQGSVDFPFMICWANENWTKKWDGLEANILLRQQHSFEDSRNFIHDVLPILKDDRYFTINGAKPLLIYRTELFNNMLATANMWRQEAEKQGVKLYLVRAESFSRQNPASIGFDAAYEFPPLYFKTDIIPKQALFWNVPPEDFEGSIYSYEEGARHFSNRRVRDYKCFPGVMTSWDNTPRMGLRGKVVYGSTPELYRQWLKAAINRTEAMAEQERLVFINAWNEWGEGAILEPCDKYGTQYLEATKEAAQ
jgi:lipopolysaccharide biosynthesis protein